MAWEHYNRGIQYYKGVSLKLVVKVSYTHLKTRCYRINETKEVLYIPCDYLEPDGTIKPNQDLDFLLLKYADRLIKTGVANPALKNPDEQEG